MYAHNENKNVITLIIKKNMYNVYAQCTLCIVHCTMHTVHCTVYNIQCTMQYTVYNTLYK